LKENLYRLVEDIERHRAACAAVAERAESQASEVAAVREELHSAIRSLNELKEAEARPSGWTSAAERFADDVVCVGAGAFSAF
jgi:hypothetical protein